MTIKSLEEYLFEALLSVCPRVYPDYAEDKVERPYIVYHRLGGQSVLYTEGVLANKINCMIQINVWSQSRALCDELSRKIEKALIEHPLLQVEPISEITTAFDDTTRLRGSMQDFSIWADRVNI